MCVCVTSKKSPCSSEKSSRVLLYVVDVLTNCQLMYLVFVAGMPSDAAQTIVLVDSGLLYILSSRHWGFPKPL